MEEAEGRLIKKAERDLGVTVTEEILEKMGDTRQRVRQEAQDVIDDFRAISPYAFDPKFTKEA